MNQNIAGGPDLTNKVGWSRFRFETWETKNLNLRFFVFSDFEF